MAKKKRGIALFVAAVFFVTCLTYVSQSVYALGKPRLEWQNGMCYTTWSKDRYSSNASDESLKALAKTGTKWVSIVATWYQEACDTTKIFSNNKTPSDSSVIHAIKTIHSLGMKAMLKPHLDLLDTSGGSWRGEIACAPGNWDAWFESYRDFVLHYAKMAQEHNVEIFCIGTELTSVATIKEQMWKEKIIAPVREAYKGPLTYAANWNEEFSQVKFWDVLDYVGIDAYFPLSEKARPTLEEIKKGWEPWIKEIEEFQKTVNKPIIFPEVGYCSAEGAAKKPWEEIAKGEVDLALQADCYQALYETFWDKSWFYGMYWWKWGTDVRFGGPGNRGFSLQNKPAEGVVTRWYKKPAPKKKK